MKLKYKLPLISMLILIVAFIFLWVGTQKTALNLIMDYQHKISLVNIERGTQQIEQNIKNGKHILKIISDMVDPNDLTWENVYKYIRVELEGSVFEKMGLVYADKTYNITGSNELGDLSDREYLKNVFEGKTTVSQIINSKVDNSYQIVIANPIIYNKEVKGALIGVIPVETIGKHIYGLNIGGKGHGILINTSADLILFSDGGDVPCDKFMEHIGVTGFVGKNGYIIYEDCEGEESYAFFKKLEETGLVALITAKQKELYLPIKNIFNKNFKFFSIVLTLALAFTSLGIRKNLKPIDNLILAMQKVEEGDYTLQIPINKQDEFANIAIQFNKTIEAISSRDEELIALNEELSESFKELNETNDKLLEVCNEVAKRLQNEKLINALSEIFYLKKDTDKLLKAILTHTAEIIEAERCAIYFYEEESNCFFVMESINFSEIDKCVIFKKDEGSVGWVVENKEELLITDILKDPRFKSKHSWSANTLMLLQIPILDKDEEVIGIISYFGDNLNLDFMPYLKQLSKTISITIQNSSLIDEMKKTYFDTVRVLVKAMELKDTYTSGHSERVMEYSLMLGEKVNLSSKELETLRYGSILHDIGKLAIPDDVLLKSGRLTDDEYDIIKTHSERGMEFIEDLEFLEDTLSIIRNHHERIDGKGYPDGLKGDEIGKLTKIVTIADAYDAIISKRAYKDALSKEEAIEELKRNKGTQFDCYLVDKFIEVISET